MTPPAPPRPPRPGKPAPSTPREPVTPDTPDTPPSRPDAGARAKDGAGAKRAPTRPASRGLQKSLEELFSAPALAYSLAGDEWAASFVAERAPVLAEAWYKLAQESPPVRRILTKLTTGSAWGGVIAASLMTAVPLLAHHGLLPDMPLPGFDRADQDRGPIVPPPPAPQGPRPTAAPGDMTPPVAPGAPPGVVTVAASNANHAGAR